MAERQSLYKLSKKPFIFIIILCTISAIILSTLSELLSKRQSQAEHLYKNQQLLFSAQIIDDKGYFLVNGQRASYRNGELRVLSNPTHIKKATPQEIFTVTHQRLATRLVNDKGILSTFKDLNIEEQQYLKNHEKLGYAQLPYKLIYLIKQYEDPNAPPGYVIPVNGYGLWGGIYGYLSLAADGTTIRGLSWYKQKETPGLGAEIGTLKWQSQFKNKSLFNVLPIKPSSHIALTILKPPVSVPEDQIKYTIDGVAGASITMEGVSDAIRTCVTPYIPLLIKAHENKVSINE